MTQEEKQLLLVDLCARLPYGIMVQLVYDEDTIKTREMGLGSLHDIMFDNAEGKPYLRPMSSMTEEEFKMVCSMNALTDTELRDRINFPDMFIKSYTIETFDLFNSHHFDYRGLIDKSLAIVAPEGMYKED